ncbi:MerR family transcriptional regulator [Bacillus cereus group sp. TH152-1LC]|uniref:MerR family transcriptional regulator n=1 Tax=Bacillus cereus group sp. TH152-1LC TaxID=3018060 RepID=UPI0022E47F24|nr:MerR family transcriptional regulator [Bacillus cereus group sp. TH152-1LC]MDA1680154.1 MerR family transcriptional regulator [Bacillus cereus group sp. TH152-1LC]
MNDTTSQERAYWTHEVSEKLQISDSTLKRWANELEVSGYKFAKGANDSRAFTAHDIQALEKYRYLTKKQKVKKEEAATAVVEEFKEKTSDWAPPAHQENELTLNSSQVAQTLETFMRQLQEQEKTNQQMLQELQSANELNKNLLLQYEQLKRDFDEMRESQKLIASTQEQKQGFWSRLFSKNKDA